MMTDLPEYPDDIAADTGEEAKTPTEIIKSHIETAENLLNSTITGPQQSGIISISKFTNPKETKENRIKLIRSGLELLQKNIEQNPAATNAKDTAEEIATRLLAIEVIAKCMSKENQKQQ